MDWLLSGLWEAGRAVGGGRHPEQDQAYTLQPDCASERQGRRGDVHTNACTWHGTWLESPPAPPPLASLGGKRPILRL